MVNISNIESPTVSSGMPSAVLKSNLTDSARPAFSDAMAAASDAALETGNSSASGPNMRHKKLAVDDEEASAVLDADHGENSQVSYQPVATIQPELSQQSLLISPQISSMQPSFDDPRTAVTASSSSINATTVTASPALNRELVDAQSVGAPPLTVKSGKGGDLAGSIFGDPVKHGEKASTMPSTTAEVGSVNVSSAVPVSAAQEQPSNLASKLVQPEIFQRVASKGIVTAGPSEVPNSTTRLSSITESTNPIVQLNSPAPIATPVVSDPLVSPTITAVPEMAVGANVNANTVPNPVPPVTPDVSLNSLPDGAHVTDSGVAVKPIVGDGVDSRVGNISTDRTIQPAPELNRLAAAPDNFGATPNRPAQLGQSVGKFNAIGGVSPVLRGKASAQIVANGKDGVKATTNSFSGLRRNSDTTSDKLGSQSDSNAGASSGSQNQSATSSQEQQAAPAQVLLGVHLDPSASHAQAGVAISSGEVHPAFANIAVHAAKAPDASASSATALPQALPIISTAKLIQSVGQSEMRVGMRSPEFGNITISTSTSRDLMSAQISLDHGELAKVLATHLPEIQAKLGGVQAVEVRIDTSSGGAGSGSSASGSSSSGYPDGSRGRKPQAGDTALNYFGDSISGRSFLSPTTMTRSDGRSNSRLDIRV